LQASSLKTQIYKDAHNPLVKNGGALGSSTTEYHRPLETSKKGF